MRAETQRLLSLIQSVAIDDLATIIGELCALKATAERRLYAVPPEPEDRLLTVAQAAKKLGVSTDYVYTHAKALGGQNPGGGKALRFSTRALDGIIKRGGR